MQYNFSTVLLILSIVTKVSAQQNDWKLVWSDEFNYNGLPDSAKWNYDTGGEGWGNDELQLYAGRRLENSRVRDGKLIIEAHKEIDGHNRYTSARLVTRHKAEWKYGRIEVRARMPKGVGSWPAIWLLPAHFPFKIPDDGEIDIMEEVGFDPCNIHATIHCSRYNQAKNNLKSENAFIVGCNRNFHIYALDWSRDSINIYADGQCYFSYANPHAGKASWPFDEPFYLVLNLAIGGTWGGIKGIDDESFPQQMEIDYVRVYQKM